MYDKYWYRELWARDEETANWGTQTNYPSNKKSRNKKMWKWIKKEHPELMAEFEEKFRGYLV